MSIELRDISKAYDGGEPILHSVNLSIASREFFVLVGPSGGGKTTLLKTINRLVEPDSGCVLIDDEDIRQLDLRQLRFQIGYVIQSIALFPTMTVGENIGLIPSLKGWDRGRVRQRVTDLLSSVDLDPAEYRDRLPAQLSGGQAQRIGILRALAGDPKILLMDEPFSALDPISRAQLQDFTVHLQKKYRITTVFVTHDMNEALKVADRIAVVSQGQIQQVDSPARIMENPANQFVSDLFKGATAWPEEKPMPNWDANTARSAT